MQPERRIEHVEPVLLAMHMDGRDAIVVHIQRLDRVLHDLDIVPVERRPCVRGQFQFATESEQGHILRISPGDEDRLPHSAVAVADHRHFRSRASYPSQIGQ